MPEKSFIDWAGICGGLTFFKDLEEDLFTDGGRLMKQAAQKATSLVSEVDI